jgi:hypothetical protein
LALPKRPFPVAAIALLLLLAGCAAAAFLFHDQLFKFGGHPTVSVPAPTNAPPTNSVATAGTLHGRETNWLLNLEAVPFPDTPAAGRIHGQDFLCERTLLQAGALILREGTKGAPDFALVINFSGAQAEVLAGKTINITSNAPLAARVTLRWQETDQTVKDNFSTGYALRLEFGPLNDNHIPGKIYFCAPDDARSYVAGTFDAEIRQPKPAKPKP